jgi:DUF4097 and DUF4098 domain-containing protein YvlB
MFTVCSGFLALAAVIQADTTFTVGAEDRLFIDHHAGSIEVGVWDRDVVRIVTDEDEHTAINVDRSGNEIRVSRRGRHATHGADYEIMLPAWLPFAFNGVNTDVTIRGTEASVRGTTVNGDIWVLGGQGLVSIRSINGDVSLENATGRIHIESVDGDVTAATVAGSVKATTVDGDVTLEDVNSESVEATTVDGDVYYAGTVSPDGRYHLATHDGDITFYIPNEVDATVKVSTFSGEFESDFPFTISKIGGNSRRFSFTLGGGSAEIILEAFDGTIELRRGDGQN